MTEFVGKRISANYNNVVQYWGITQHRDESKEGVDKLESLKPISPKIYIHGLKNVSDYTDEVTRGRVIELLIQKSFGGQFNKRVDYNSWCRKFPDKRSAAIAYAKQNGITLPWSE